MLSVSQSDHERYEDGEGNKIAGNDSRQQLGLVKVVGDLPGDQTVKLSHEIRTDDGERTMRPQWAASSPRNQVFPLNIQRDTTTLNYGYAPAGNPWVDLGLTTYHTESGIERDPENTQGMRYNGSVRSTGGDLRNTSRIADLSLVYGIDYREDKARAWGEGASHEEEGEVLGVYLQADYWLTRDLMLSAGARYDDYSLEDAIGQTFDHDDVSPNVNAAWQVLDGLTLKAGYAQAFRGATTHDTFKLYDARNDAELIGEKARNTEVGFDYVRGGFSLSGEVYRSEIRDAIADPLIPWGETLYTNVGDLESDGYLIATGYQWQAISAGLSFHSNDAEVDGKPLTVYEHNLLGNTIGDTWIADLAYRFDRTLEFGWQGRFVEGIDNLEAVEGNTIDKPGYGVHDLYAHWLPTGSEDLRLTLTIKNVGDKQYLDHASNADYTHIPGYGIVVGNPEPGRDIRFGLAMRF
jgi:hemoglobin/transferrin/lactoferrin receptor protein